MRRRRWHPTPVLLPGKSHGWRSLVGWSPWGREESDMTERLPFHFSLSCIGEGNGNLLQCSCLENPRDGGAWWAAVYGVTQSRTRLKRLSSSSKAEMRESPALGLNESRMCQNPHPGLLPHHFHPLTLHPGTNPSLYRSAVMRVLWSLGGVTLRKEAGGGNPSTRRHGDLVTPPSLTTHRVHHPLGALGLAWLSHSPCGSETVVSWEGPGTPDQRVPFLAHPSQLPQP